MRPTVVGCGWCVIARRGGPLLLLAALVGCGGSETGMVSGRVLYGKAKEPLPGGFVTFAPADPKHSPVSGEIDANGHYQLTVPVGEVQISVDNQHLMPAPADAPPSLPPDLVRQLKVKPPAPAKKAAAPVGTGKYRKIPEKYYRTDLSELKYTVTSGAQKHDVELKGR